MDGGFSIDTLHQNWPLIVQRHPLLKCYVIKYGQERLLFHHITDVLRDSQYIVKTVTIERNLAWHASVAGYRCTEDEFTKDIILNSSYAVVTLLYDVLKAMICTGCANEKYECLKPKVVDQSGQIIGTCEQLGDKRVHRSVKCLGLIHVRNQSSACSNCKQLKPLLTVQVSRYKALESSANREQILKHRESSKSRSNWRYLEPEQVLLRATDEKRRRVNAELREANSKRKVAEERNAKIMSEEWHEDLSTIYREIDSTNMQGQENVFSENPDMKLFWKLQHDMIEKKTRKWHPRYTHMWLNLKMPPASDWLIFLPRFHVYVK